MGVPSISASPLRATFHEPGGVSTGRSVEIFHGVGKDERLQVDVTEKHGPFYADECFASTTFSLNGRNARIVYTAEQNAPSSKDPFDFYRFRPDFGERLVGKKCPGLFLGLWNSFKDVSIQRIQTTSPNTQFGQAIFSPVSHDILYATGYEPTSDGRMLGMYGCFNRPAGIWKLVLPEEIQQQPKNLPVTSAFRITPPHLSCRSPLSFFQGSNAKLVWLSAVTGGPHMSTDALWRADISSSTDSMPTNITPLVDVVDAPLQNGDFPGLYAPYNIPAIINSGNADPAVVIHSQWGSRTTVLSICGVTGTVKDLTPDEDGQHFSWTVLASDGGSRILATRSNPAVPYELMLGEFKDGEVEWKVVEQPTIPHRVREALRTLKTEIISVPDREPLETIVIQSSGSKEDGEIPPCITWPHGGPHVGSSTEFSPLISAMALAGYTISQPNYTGSQGYGDKFLRALVGKCGTLDVEDCMASAEHLIKLGISERGPGKQFVTGGSHGGFLTGHLIAKYPTFFSAAVMRNAVTSATDVTTTDIPDWYHTSFGLDDGSKPTQTTLPLPTITPSMYEILQEASPISKADQVQIPVLILAGEEDRRVAPSQSVEYYHALKARVNVMRHGSQEAGDSGKKGLDVELLMFKGEGHSLDGVETSRVNFEVMREWFGRARV